MQESSVIQVNLAAVQHNMRVLRRIVGENVRLCPIIKADGYGLGAWRVGRNLVDAGAHMLAVYTPQQATEVMRGSIEVPVLVLMPVYDIGRTDELYRGMIRGRLHLTVHDGKHLDALLALSERFGCMLPIHLEVDTGMNRSGCPLEEATSVLRRIADNPRTVLYGVFTHFSSAASDTNRTNEQVRQFDEFLESNRPLIPDECLVHVANTPAALRHARYHRSMVRIGLGWAGYGLELLKDGEIISEAQELMPAVTWSSRIVQIRTVAERETVGYDATWTSRRPTRLALVPVGYCDGYPATLGATDDSPERGYVGVLADSAGSGQRGSGSRNNGNTPLHGGDGCVHYCPVVGQVNMDQITIDITDLPEGAATVGTKVELVSPDVSAPNHLPRIAELSGTFAHELLCRLSTRLKRTYYSSDENAPASLHPSAAHA